MSDAPTGKVTFVGAGPGAADLLTFRAARAIAEADVVIWAASLVQAEVLEHARQDAEILDSATMSLEDVVAVYARARDEGLKVARIHSGDPALWAAPRSSSTGAWSWASPRRSCRGCRPSRRWRRSRGGS